MHLHIHHHYDAPADPRLDQILAAVRLNGLVLATINTKVSTIMATLADIQTAETAESAAIDGVVADIASLNAELTNAQALGADPATMQAIVDQIHANTAKLTAALPPAAAPNPPAAA